MWWSGMHNSWPQEVPSLKPETEIGRMLIFILTPKWLNLLDYEKLNLPNHSNPISLNLVHL